MGRRYDLEMAALAETYSWACSASLDRKVPQLGALAAYDLYSVGVGGSFVAADFLARLHRATARRAAHPHTTLDAVLDPPPRNHAALLVSAGGRNPDALRAFDALLRAEPRELVLVTSNPDSPLAGAARTHPYSRLLSVDGPVKKDGFLATNTLLAALVVSYRCYATLFGLPPLPPSLDDLLAANLKRDDFEETLSTAGEHLASARYIIVLGGGWADCATLDFEARLSEAALAAPLRFDLRNFAHGRHNWLVRRAKETAIVTFSSTETMDLAEDTAQLFPASTRNVMLRTTLEGPIAAISLVAQSMLLTHHLSKAQGIDPGRPSVEEWGRKLYHLGPGRLSTLSRRAIIIARKSGPNADASQLRHWKDRLERYSSWLINEKVQGLVLDYDGTLVEAEGRFEPPRSEVAESLQRVLSLGLRLGIATGRGKSVRKDLQKIVEPRYWKDVLVGYYNGSQIATLSDDERPDGSAVTKDKSLSELVALLEGQQDLLDVNIEPRSHQITLTPVRPVPPILLWREVQSVVFENELPLGCYVSTHSVDVLSSRVSKNLVVKELARIHRLAADSIARIGDRGAWPGNDCQLLNHPLGFSVDEVSSNPLGCWNMCATGVRGTNATTWYMDKMDHDDAGFALKGLIP